MHKGAIQRILGLLLILFSVTLLPPILIDLVFREKSGQAFFCSYILLLCAGFILWLPVLFMPAFWRK